MRWRGCMCGNATTRSLAVAIALARRRQRQRHNTDNHEGKGGALTNGPTRLFSQVQCRRAPSRHIRMAVVALDAARSALYAADGDAVLEIQRWKRRTPLLRGVDALTSPHPLHDFSVRRRVAQCFL